VIPDKLYYRIGEVEALTEIPAYVLRYWESEFKLLRPKKNPAGQRLYRKKDLELVLRIDYRRSARFAIEHGVNALERRRKCILDLLRSLGPDYDGKTIVFRLALQTCRNVDRVTKNRIVEAKVRAEIANDGS
jgi:DNA-binding transcriptional MerR regulator